MKFDQWIEAAKYRVTSGGQYGWDCFGPHAQIITADHADGPSIASASVVFDTVTLDVYQATVGDFAVERAYRWTNADYYTAYQDEVKRRDTNDMAWDDVKWIDLEVPEDYLEKARAIMASEQYDTRVQVPLDLEDDVILNLALRAHERDITLNEMVEIVLKEAINRSALE